MKKLGLVLVAALAVQFLFAQVKLSPKWQVGAKETLELTQSKTEISEGENNERDSVYALIEQEVLSVDDTATHFSWMVKKYYRNVAELAEKEANAAPYIKKFVEKYPIKFYITHKGYKPALENEDEIETTMTKMVEESDTSKGALVVSMSASSGLSKLYTGMPEKYYAAYKDGDFKLGEKKPLIGDDDDIKQMKKIGMEMNGSTMWTEVAPNAYNKHTEAKMDGMKFIASLMKSLKGAFDDDKKSKKKSKEDDKKMDQVMENSHMDIDINGDLTVDKTTHHVTAMSFITYIDTDMMGEKSKATEKVFIKKLK